MKLASTVTGTWTVPSTMAEGKFEFMHIGSDGKLVHFVHTDDSGERTVHMTLWLEPQGGDDFLVKADPKGESWVVGLVPTVNGVTIVRPEIQFHLTRPLEDEMPLWFNQKLETVLIRMAERESKARRAE